MRAALFNGPRSVAIGERPDPAIEAPSDAVGTCPHCRNGVTVACPVGGSFGNGTIDGGQGEAVRVPLASSTLVPVPGSGHADEMLRSLLTLSDVMSTGHHAAVSARVAPGHTVAVVGVPHGAEVPFNDLFFRNVGWHGGPAPARRYIPDLLVDVLDGRIHPGLVFDYETDLDHIADAYDAMDQRRAIKSLVRIGSL